MAFTVQPRQVHAPRQRCKTCANIMLEYVDMIQTNRLNRNRGKPSKRGDVQISLGVGARRIRGTTRTGEHLPLPVSFSLPPASEDDMRFGERGTKGSPIFVYRTFVQQFEL